MKQPEEAQSDASAAVEQQPTKNKKFNSREIVKSYQEQICKDKPIPNLEILYYYDQFEPLVILLREMDLCLAEWEEWKLKWKNK